MDSYCYKIKSQWPTRAPFLNYEVDITIKLSKRQDIKPKKDALCSRKPSQRFRSGRHLYTGLEVGQTISSSRNLRFRPFFCLLNWMFLFPELWCATQQAIKLRQV